MSADYINVSKEIILSGKHRGPDFPVEAYGLLHPNEDRIDCVGAAVSEPNPDDEDGIYELRLDGNKMLFSDGQSFSGDLFVEYEDEINKAVREAAKQIHI